LNLGLIIYGSLETVSGGFFYDRMLVDHLKSKGNRVKIFSLPWRNYARRLLDNFSGPFIQSLSAANLDILIQDELNHPSLFRLNQKLKDRVRYPIVSIVHHLRSRESRPDWQNRLYRVVESDYLRTVDGFVFASRTTGADVKALTGRDVPSIVASPGRDLVAPVFTPDQVKARSFEPGPLRVLFVGSLIRRKELHTLIAGLASVPQANWKLDVVGGFVDRPYAQEIKRQIEREGLSERISLLGVVTGEALKDYYQKSHLVAVPSSYEGFGIVYMEGMGYGLPAIASTAGAAHEIVTHGQNGFLVRPGDTAAIAENIEELNRDREKLFRMGLNALDRYRKHPTWDESTSKIAEFLQSMVN
jgi:glycosyltransferase involved in cell wall biosynthesis